MKTIMRFLMLSLLLSLPALAQDVPAAPVVGNVNLDADPLGLVPLATALVREGRFGALALVALFALVWAVRKFAAKLPEGKVRDALLSKWGGWGLNFALGLAGGFASLALSGVAVNLALVLGVIGGAVSFSLGAAGLRELGKDVLPGPKVETLDDAAKVMAKGPQP